MFSVLTTYYYVLTLIEVIINNSKNSQENLNQILIESKLLKLIKNMGMYLLGNFNKNCFSANQETIVELIGFTQRVMGPKATTKKPPSDVGPEEPITTSTYSYTLTEDEPKVIQELKLNRIYSHLGRQTTINSVYSNRTVDILSRLRDQRYCVQF